MGLFNSKGREDKKREKQENIAKWNKHIRKCAQTNRIAQIQHLEEYLKFPSFEIDLVMAKVFCKQYKDFESNELKKSININFYDKYGNIPQMSLPIDGFEAARVFFKIIPFYIVADNPEWWLGYIDWNHGSDYDCDDSYSGKTYFFADEEENFDTSIKSENDVFVQKHEIQYLPDIALLYLANTINNWKEINFAEIVGNYNIWKNKRDFLVSYEDIVSKEIDKRGLAQLNEEDTKDESESSTNYGAKGEQDVEYSLKWLPKEYKTIQRTKEKGIQLLCPSVSNESQEIDHIVVGQNGVFLIETKYLKGNITIDINGNWSREIDGIFEGVRNPVQQIDRHYSIVNGILDGIINKEDIHNIICLAYDTCTISGIENSPVTVVKSDMLERHIMNCQSNRKYSESDIETIVERIEQHRL